MKKTVVLFSFFITAITSAQFVEPGDLLLSGSAGLINFNYHVQGEYAIADNITAGIFLGVFKDRDVATQHGVNIAVLKEEVNAFGIRGSYHIVNDDFFNFYTGLDTGVGFLSIKGETESEKGQIKENRFLYGGHIGIRFALTDNLALFAETGYISVYNLKLGASVRF